MALARNLLSWLQQRVGAMDEGMLERIRQLPRHDLELFAVRAALHIHTHREEADSGDFFTAALFGFLLGAAVAASGFLLGVRLG